MSDGRNDDRCPTCGGAKDEPLCTTPQWTDRDEMCTDPFHDLTPTAQGEGGCLEPTRCEQRDKAECEWCLNPKPTAPSDVEAVLAHKPHSFCLKCGSHKYVRLPMGNGDQFMCGNPDCGYMVLPPRVTLTPEEYTTIRNHIATQSRELAETQQQLARYEGALDAACDLLSKECGACPLPDNIMCRAELLCGECISAYFLAQQDGTKDAASSVGHCNERPAK